jgi:hypothetical protein
MTTQQPVTIDHLILGIGNLERGVAEFEQLTGVRPVSGGVHPGMGTQNALISLGEGRYLEILAPAAGAPADTPTAKELGALQTLTPVGWAVASVDLPGVRARAEAAGLVMTQVTLGSRKQPDGGLLEWSTSSVTAPRHALMPFFIQWKDAARQPSHTSPAGCTLTSLTIEDPDTAPLQVVFSTFGLSVPVKQSTESRMTIALQCPKGPVTFGQAPAPISLW